MAVRFTGRVNGQPDTDGNIKRQSSKTRLIDVHRFPRGSYFCGNIKMGHIFEI